MVIILANGEFPKRPDRLALLHEATLLVCCDGAANACVAYGITPDIIIGDVDSVSPELKIALADRVIHVQDQEINDLTKAFRYVLSQGHRKITILGATGLREDHTLGNLALLMDYSEEAEVEMLSDYGRFYPCKDLCRLSVRKGQEVSIFNFGATGFASKGLQYSLYDFTKLWQGTLNTALEENIEVSAQGRFLVYVSEE